ncbi:hypothetical protein RHGRI_001037 [Rhododendron griersonianum]|uniref:Secreted protein n=1 Tax=Rhododendron griersonianum TaxID=479676 RepID=A0AAV6LLA8_9ERIC|nr:hypothetical protein RHGRI_029256 [Rhododendron griersonianum]KAG5565023.1 hypothetical protein RHGRI_001037 [Rhododendron griersonianum]
MPVCCAFFSHLLRLKVVLLLWCGESGAVVVVVTDGGEQETGLRIARRRNGGERERERYGRWGLVVAVMVGR